VLGLRDVAPGDRRRPADRVTLGLVGSLAQPRFLLPVDHRAATDAACLRYQRLRPARTRATRAAVALAPRVGLGSRVVTHRYTADRSPGSLLHHLAGLLGVDDLQVAVGVGNHDAVWKPTLQCFTPAGEPVAYVKVGLGAVADLLVTTERDALERWEHHPDPRLVVPNLLAATTWQDHPVICTAPMPADVRRLPAGATSPWPVRQLDPPLPDGSVATAPWWTERRREHADVPEVDDLLDRIEARHGTEVHAWARWHGDWVPWNLARCHRGLVAWDWEYSEPGAPVGLDEVHGRYQVERVARGAGVDAALRTAHGAVADPWLPAAHLAMLVTRHARLARLAGTEVGDHRAVLAAARTRLDHRG
jgi:hypothetical protein